MLLLTCQNLPLMLVSMAGTVGYFAKGKLHVVKCVSSDMKTWDFSLLVCSSR